MLQLLALAISVAYVGLICGVLIVKFVTPLNNFLKYGKCYNSKAIANENWILQRFLHLTVPKYFFWHFYVLFSASMLLIVSFPRRNSHYSLAKHNNYTIITCILLAQALRRLSESIYVLKPNQLSRMNIAHYTLGLVFYSLMSINCYLGLTVSKGLQFSVLDTILITVYIITAYDQFLNHKHLALLKKYSMPTRGLFLMVACAHYLDEIVIYTIVAALALKNQPNLVDVNFGLAALFVAVNLSISSRESHEYYKRFGTEYKAKWSIVPRLV